MVITRNTTTNKQTANKRVCCLDLSFSLVNQMIRQKSVVAQNASAKVEI